MAKPDAKPHLTRRQAENVRAAIKVGNIVDRLEKAVAGEITMTPTQVQAAKILLDNASRLTFRTSQRQFLRIYS